MNVSILAKYVNKIKAFIQREMTPKRCYLCGEEEGSNHERCENCFDAAYSDRAAP